MNPFLSRLSNNSWVVPVSALALVLGVMVRMSWINETDRTERLSRLDPSQRERIRSGSVDMIEEYKRLHDEVRRLQGENTRLQNAMGSRNSQTSELNRSLQTMKMFAAQTQVEGPGVTITLTDMRPQGEAGFVGNDQIIHDTDVLKVVNELWAAGAEAISVNDHRVGPMSSFRCVGPVIHVDRIPIASPVVIRAIGESDVLFGGMDLPGGVLDEIRQTDPKMVRMEKATKLVLPALTGAPSFKRAKAVATK
jgi:uncharacterized protein YlxW (UPF0749 family)